MQEQPWFIRLRRFLGYRLRPSSRAGWITTGVFLAGALLLGSVQTNQQFEGSALVVWALILTFWAIGFVVLAHLKSVPVVRHAKQKRGRGGRRER